MLHGRGISINMLGIKGLLNWHASRWLNMSTVWGTSSAAILLILLQMESIVGNGRRRLVAMNCGVRGTDHTLLQSMTKDSSFEYLWPKAQLVNDHWWLDHGPSARRWARWTGCRGVNKLGEEEKAQLISPAVNHCCSVHEHTPRQKLLPAFAF